MHLSICPVCGGEIFSVITEKQVPPFQNKLFSTCVEATSVIKVPLSMVACHSCGFIFNRFFDPDIDRYDTQYCSEQRVSNYSKQHLNELANYLYCNYLQSEDIVLEIGCGYNGAFLKDFIKNAPLPCHGIGYDPSYEESLNITFNQAETDDRQILFYSQLFTKESPIPPNTHLVIARHLIEHLPDPTIFLESFASQDSSLILCIETPDVSWILETGTWYDFFDEHCSLYSPASIAELLYRNGFEVLEIKQTFGDQYMQVFAQKSQAPKHLSPSLFTQKQKLIETMSNYKLIEKESLDKCITLLSSIKRNGNCVVWGGGAKANTFLNMFDPDRSYILFVIDINPHKWGKFIAGTGHEIVPPSEITKHNITSVIIMNPNYEGEIKKMISDLNITSVQFYLL